MLRKTTATAAYVINYQGMCANAIFQMTNELQPQQQCFIKIAVLYCTGLVNYAVQQIVQSLLLVKTSLHGIKLQH